MERMFILLLWIGILMVGFCEGETWGSGVIIEMEMGCSSLRENNHVAFIADEEGSWRLCYAKLCDTLCIRAIPNFIRDGIKHQPRRKNKGKKKGPPLS